MENCIFCKIIKNEIKSDKLYEDDFMIIIKDINPIAPIHLLLVPKKHYSKLYEQTADDVEVLGKCLNKLSLIKNELNLSDGYRLIINQGKNAQQTVEHLHIHILGGKILEWDKL